MSNEQLAEGFPKGKATLASVLITQAIAFFGCVLVPIFVTSLAPKTRVTLVHETDYSSAEVTRYALLWLPLSTVKLAPILEAKSHVTDGDYRVSHEERISGRIGILVPDGSLLLVGADTEIRVQSTPEDASGMASAIEAFIRTPQEQPLVVTATTGWLFTYLLGGIMTSLTALYCFGVVASVFKFFWLSVKPLKADTTLKH